MQYKSLPVFMVVIALATHVHSQEILQQLASKLSKEYETTAKELLVLQTDKQIYKAGTELWFRLYSISSNGASADNKDKVIYAELVNDKDKVIDRILLNKEGSQYNGSFTLSAGLDDGFYQLRAYTKSILQNYPGDMCIKPVYVFNSGREELKTYAPGTDPVYKFYVEGDNLVNGVPCTVLLTAMDNAGKLFNVTGLVKDNFNNEVAKFSGNGLVKIVFQPYSKDRTYQIIFVKTNNSIEQVLSLPAIKTGAFQLSLQKHDANELAFRVALGDSAYNKKAASHILGMANGKVCFAASGNAMYMVNIPVTSLPHGIIDFYLFDENKELKSRRSVFNNNYTSAVNITSDRQEYNSRQKAKINIEILDNENKPLKTVFSLLVTDKKLTGENYIHDADKFLLARNGSGLPVEKFINDTGAMDLLAMTLTENGKYLKNIPEVKTGENIYWDGLEIKGRVTDKQNNPLANEVIVLMPEQENETLNGSTDSKGAFVFRNMSFYGKKGFHVMLPALYNKQKYEATEEPMAFPAIKTNSEYLNDIDRELWKNFKAINADSSIAGNTKIQLQQLAMMEETGNKKAKTGRRNDLLSPRRITAEQLDKLSMSNTADAVKMLPGVVMLNGRLTIRGGIQTLAGDLSDVEPLLIVDGVQTRAGSVVDYLNSIPPSNIEYIEVYTGPEASLYGTRGGNGAIVVKTSNEIRTKKNDTETPAIVASGFYKDQVFYQPPYDSYAVREASFTDNRATIYWNGEVITDSTGRATVSFYTADLKNDYAVTVQGITEKGELVFKTVTIKKR